MKFRYSILTVWICFYISCNCSSQSNENTRYKFHWLTVENGLSNNRVTSITKCKNGYIWIGTDDGLDRYDGFTCKYYQAKLGDNYFDKLNQQITALFTDNQNNVWIGAYKLFQYNYQYDTIEPYFNNTKTEQPTRIRAFYQSSDNIIWIGARNGLFSFSPSSKKWIHYPPFAEKLYFELWDLLVHNNLVWMATKENGLYIYDIKKRNYSQIPLINDKGEKVVELLCAYIDTEGKIWIGSKNDGIFIVDPISKKLLSNEIFDQKCRRIRKIGKDKHGNYWIGTNEGLFVKNYLQNKIVKYTDEDDFFSPISQNSVHTIFFDQHETMWLGTFAGGVCYADMEQKKFIPFIARNDNNLFLNDRIVASIVADKSDNLYLGVGTSGLNIYYKKTGRFSFFPLKPYTFGGINIKCMAFDSKNILWIGSYQGRITRFDPETKIFTAINNEKASKKKLQSDAIQSIAIDNYDNIWVGTDKGVDFIGKGSNDVENVFKNNGACYIYIDRKGEIWTGVSGDGVFLWNEKLGKFQSRFQENMIATLNTLYRDANNHLWIGEKNGLSCIDLNDSSYHKSPNLSQSNNIQSILEDNNHNIWVGTSFGLIKCINAAANIDSFETRAYYKADGLPSNYFWKNSAYKSPTGELYFGSSNGYIEFFPDSIKDNTFIPNINFVNLKISNNEIAINQKYGGKIILTKSLSETDEISLSYRQRPFTIEFIALHYANPESNLYAYMLYPLEKEWNYTKAPRNFATYYSIPGGKYTFRVKAANSDGIWNETPAELKIKIVPPFWKTKWFIITISILLLSLLVVIYYQRLYSIQLQRAKLEKLVDERTLEISLKNTDLELQKQQILIQSGELTQQKVDLEELNSMKDKMFSIIAHDLKNPFNAVLGFSDILLRKYNKLAEEKKLKYIQLISESSLKIYSLLENLLIWSRAQIHVLPFNPIKADLHDLIVQNVKLSEADYWKKNINVVINIHSPINVYCDTNMMNSVIRNLITNAIKFTDNDGKIEISHIEQDNLIEVLVKDNGIGIDAKNISQLFKVGNSLKNKGTYGEEGSGLGLLLCKEFVNKHGGKIWVESQEGAGSTFHFTLPKNGNTGI